MQELRFDERVAVITGGGRGLGRAYALLLASRGAKVVVNDPGASLDGKGIDSGPAQLVVEEIRAAGGDAVACTESVATPAGGKAIIESALDHFGRLDILIHNAGVVRRAPLAEMTYEDFELVLDVHLRGAFHVVRPAFPIMCKAGLRAHRADLVDQWACTATTRTPTTAWPRPARSACPTLPHWRALNTT
jgi:NAD(P)-dependent dehydrogenase (short-subunit alcohol dehydrogenase family)